MSKKRAIILTILTSFLGSGITAICGLIYNQKVMELYGSQVNGLISTLGQFVSMFVLLEGGFTVAATVSMYGPAANNDLKQVKNIFYTIQNRFRQLGTIIFVLAMGFGIIYMQFLDSSIPTLSVFFLLAITAVTTAGTIFFQSKYSAVYNGYNLQYIQTIIGLTTKTLTWILSIVLIVKQCDIVIVYSVSILNLVLTTLICRLDVAKRLNLTGDKGEIVTIVGTNDVFLQKISSTVFSSTDLVLISVGVGLAQASVYNIYHQIYVSVNGILNSIISAPLNSFGQMINESDKNKFNLHFSAYQKFVLLLSMVVFSGVSMTIVNFVRIFTARVTDINYIVPQISLLFFAQFFLTAANIPLGTALNISKNFKEQNLQCILSAVVNLVCSLIFMQLWGVLGIILGSVIGVLIIFSFNAVRCKKLEIIQIDRYALDVLLHGIIGIVIIYFALFVVPYQPTNYYTWFFVSVLEFTVFTGLVLLINYIVDKNKTERALGMAMSILIKKK